MKFEIMCWGGGSARDGGSGPALRRIVFVEENSRIMSAERCAAMGGFLFWAAAKDVLLFLRLVIWTASRLVVA